MTLEQASVVVASYLLGTIPVGILAGRMLAGVDPREAGSRNIGFTNVLRVGGKLAGLVTLLGDLGKGALAVLGARAILGPSAGDWALAAGAAVVVGHIYPVFLRFKGGKGVAAALGVFLAIDPAIGAGLVLIWVVSAAVWRISSLAALVAFGALPMIVWMVHPRPAMMALALGVSGLIAYRHSGNIRRLLAGNEPKFGMH
ncbi:MAG TPA: glycerol-3-phosphate 1-O-acyltransferase PlsY [Nitrospirales bacterium]|nr:glycerol-3-phosphate 1-O-acyltransferase PlsY [Nitrospirales bacterium]